MLMRKEFLQLRRDPMLLRLLLIMPFLQLLMLGYVVGADIQDLRLAVVDLDRTPVSRELESSFRASGYFVIAEHLDSEDGLRELLDKGDAVLALVVPEGTAADVSSGRVAPVGLVVDGSNSQVSTVASAYAAQIVSAFNLRLAARSGGAVSASVPSVDVRVRVEYNPTLAPINVMIPGLVCFAMMLSLMLVMSMAVVRERESGTLEQMFTTPIRPGEYLVGKIAPYAMLAAAQSVLVGIVGALWFQVPFIGNIWIALTGMLLFLLACIGLGLLISLVSNTRQQAQQAVLFTLLPSMVLSGFVFPVDSMPDVLAGLSQFFPITHALVVLRAAFLKNSGFADVAQPLLLLLAFAVVFFTSAVIATHRRLTD
jgi:ABC-2 type transport system permease protein